MFRLVVQTRTDQTWIRTYHVTELIHDGADPQMYTRGKWAKTNLPDIPSEPEALNQVGQQLLGLLANEPGVIMLVFKTYDLDVVIGRAFTWDGGAPFGGLHEKVIAALEKVLGEQAEPPKMVQEYGHDAGQYL